MRTSIRLSGGTAILVGLTVLAACGGGAAPAGSPASSPAAASAAAKPAGASASAKPVASAAASASSTGSIKVGFIVPLTGVAAPVGQDNLDGFNVYLQSINNTVAGRKIEVVTGDEGQPDTALTKA